MNDGAVERQDDRYSFRYQRRLRQPVEVVWPAITEPAEIERWTGSRPEIEPHPDGRYVSYHGTGDRVVDRVTRVTPHRLFEHTFWVQINPSALVTWTLEPATEGTDLTLVHALDRADIEQAAAAMSGSATASPSAAAAEPDAVSLVLSRNAAGWHRLLDRLTQTLDGHTVPWSREEQQALQQHYATLLPA